MSRQGYVIPLSAFVVGDYESAFEALVRQMRIQSAARIGPDSLERITPPRNFWGRLQRHTGIWALRRRFERWRRARHRRIGLAYVCWLQDELLKKTGHPMDWNEEGDMVVGHQVFSGTLEALVSYAFRLEYPEAFRKMTSYVNEEGKEVSLVDALDERRRELKLESQRFPHLCSSSETWVPVAFDPPQRVEDPTKADEPYDFLRKTWVASSVRLLDELNELNDSLDIDSRWSAPAFELPNGGDEPPGFEGVHIGWLFMEGFARASLEHRLPICMEY